jgi:hypothetical protein
MNYADFGIVYIGIWMLIYEFLARQKVSVEMSDYIPPELLPNILARLSVDDAVRCTSVCKSWYSLITCPSFVSSHLNLSSPYHEPRLLVRYCKYGKFRLSYCLHRDNQTFDEIAKLDIPISFKFGNYRFNHCGGCDVDSATSGNSAWGSDQFLVRQLAGLQPLIRLFLGGATCGFAALDSTVSWRGNLKFCSH